MFANGKPPQVEKLDEEGNVIRDAGGYAETEPMPETSVLHALNGGFLLNAIGAENGPAAQIISVIIKTNLYIEGKARLVRDPDACARTSCATVIDECQLIMTTGPDSDADTWNTARETGLFLIAATQNYAALESRLGDKGTSNIVNLLCTKIFLKSQDVEKTHPLAIKLGGTALGGLVAYEGLYATQADREMEVPDVYPGVGFGGFSLEAVMPTSPAVGVGGMKDAVGFDNRFVLEHRTLSNGGPGQPAQTNRDAVLGSQGQAAHRQEDQNRTALTGGVTRQNVLSSEDLMGGGGLAFVVAQRAGESVIDIIDLRSLVVEAEAKDKREEKEREAAAQKLAA
jgi:hypothetical protein